MENCGPSPAFVQPHNQEPHGATGSVRRKPDPFRSLRDLDVDQFRFGIFIFRHMNRKDAVFELGVDLRRISIIRQREAAGETPIRPFHPMIPPAFLFLL
jgi:hypothetical protein